jgi:hypothetical protein
MHVRNCYLLYLHDFSEQDVMIPDAIESQSRKERLPSEHVQTHSRTAMKTSRGSPNINSLSTPYSGVGVIYYVYIHKPFGESTAECEST